MPNKTPELLEWFSSVKTIVENDVISPLVHDDRRNSTVKEYYEEVKTEVTRSFIAFSFAKGSKEESEVDQDIREILLCLNQDSIGDQTFASLHIDTCKHSELENLAFGFLNKHIDGLVKEINNSRNIITLSKDKLSFIDSNVCEIIRMFEGIEPFEYSRMDMLSKFIRKTLNDLKTLVPTQAFPEFPEIAMEKPIREPEPVFLKGPLEIWEHNSRRFSSSRQFPNSHSAPLINSSIFAFKKSRSPSAPTLMPPPSFGL